MSSIQLPSDLKILKLLEQPHTRYDVMKCLGNHYASTLRRIDRLEKLGYIFVYKTSPWGGTKQLKLYLITTSGRAMARGFEEAKGR